MATTFSGRDPNTLSNYLEIRTTHIAIDFDIDFGKKVLSGNVDLSLKGLLDSGVKKVVLDTSYLDISSVIINKKAVEWQVGARQEPNGSPLTIQLNDSVSKDEEIVINIKLATTEKCTALQWLEPEQTSNKKYPYMFSQCQPIHARSILPCQDTPDVKATVNYKLRSLFQVLASGLYKSANSTIQNQLQTYKFQQANPVPSYLIAIASGELASVSIGPRSTVWTGPEELDGCRWELDGDMEKFMDAAEAIVFPYAWGEYNVLILPSSFPFGGMENPNYTFATPTIISKDKQNIGVIAHELSHSWSGNLVSNCSWEHFWLNEGWTTYLERRIQAKIHGEPFRDFSSIIGWKALTDSIEKYGKNHEFTKLVVNLKDKDPDDFFSSIPYEKGYVFLDYLEKLVGRDKWDKFIPHYFKTWRFKSLDSYEFKDTLTSFFSNDQHVSDLLAKIDWQTWYNSSGYPPKPNYDDSLARVCYDLADKWKAKATVDFTPSPNDIEGWFANQSVVFLGALQLGTPLRPQDSKLLGQTYEYAKSFNVELVSRYYIVGLLAKDESVYQPTADLLGKVGRVKFVRPLYEYLNNVDRDLAIKTFEKNATFYHPICRSMVEKTLFGKK